MSEIETNQSDSLVSNGDTTNQEPEQADTDDDSSKKKKKKESSKKRKRKAAVINLRVVVGVEVVAEVIKKKIRKKEKSVAAHAQEVEVAHDTTIVAIVAMVVDIDAMVPLQESFVIIGCGVNRVSMKIAVVFHMTLLLLYLG